MKFSNLIYLSIISIIPMIACGQDTYTIEADGKFGNMSAKEIADALANYRNDPKYGGKLKHLMAPVAKRLNPQDQSDIIAYLKDDKSDADKAKTTPNSNRSQ